MNMDRFRLRVWDKTAKVLLEVNIEGNLKHSIVYLHPILHEFDNTINYWENPDNWILMACTGLRDSEGTLIWESDIIEYKTIDEQTFLLEGMSKIKVFGIVKWYEDGFKIQNLSLEQKQAFYGYDGSTMFNWGLLKVIGNIWENSNYASNQNIHIDSNNPHLTASPDTGEKGEG